VRGPLSRLAADRALSSSGRLSSLAAVLLREGVGDLETFR
jgi:hypothetical protein